MSAARGGHDDDANVAALGGADGRADLHKSVLGRAALLIEAFDIDRPLLSLNHLSDATGLPRSTVHRLAEQLVAIGWLEHAPSGYRLGMRLFELAGLVAGRNRLRARALPVMNELAAEVGSAVSLAVLDHVEVVYLDNIAPEGVALPVRLRRMPAHCTGLGKVMLAFAGDEHVEAVLRHGLTAQTPNTIVDADRLRDSLAEIRESGVAFDREEAVIGFGCVAAPIRGAGRALAAVSATLPIDQIDLEVLAPRLRDAATEIWSSLFSNREGTLPPTSQRRRSADQATVSSLERAVSAELGQWLKYDDWL